LEDDFGCIEVDGEVLWGLTYRIIELFLDLVLGFKLPTMKSRRLRELTLAADYFDKRR
jgi:hypothetical protein